MDKTLLGWCCYGYVVKALFKVFSDTSCAVGAFYVFYDVAISLEELVALDMDKFIPNLLEVFLTGPLVEVLTL